MRQSESTKIVFRRIRNYLAGRLVGATRDAALMQEVVKCLFAFSYADRSGRAIQDEILVDHFDIAQKYRRTFAEVRNRLPRVFPETDEILMDPVSIAHVHNELLSIDLAQCEADPLGDLYETFVGTSAQKNEGQFFTPHAAVEWLVNAVDPQPGERVIDPACGAGGFLSFTAKRLLRAGVAPTEVAARLYGIEKDAYLAGLANAHIALSTLTDSNVTCGDSLALTDENGRELPREYCGGFDVVLTNPPFGAQINSGSDAVRRGFELAFKWKYLSEGRSGFHRTDDLQSQTPPQVLFVERCLSLLRPGGRLGIVVPESLISSSSYAYVVQFLIERANLRAVVGMPESLFKTSGKGGTHTKTCLVVAEKNASKRTRTAEPSIFFAEAKWCGKDSRGREIDRNDLPAMLRAYRLGERKSHSVLGYWIKPNEIAGHNLSPRYRDPEAEEGVSKLASTHHLVSIGELVDQGLLEFSTGDEVGKLAYGTGNIPFVRTSDISNWEIKIDAKHGVSEAVYEKYRTKQDVRSGDILLVRDGTYLVGSCAFVSEFDERIVFQSHLYKIRCRDAERMSPYLLLALLSSEPVQAQIKAKRVTQDIIDSLGSRVFELVLPIPKDATVRTAIEQLVESSVQERILAREHARFAKRAVLMASSDALQKLATKAGVTGAVPDVSSTGRRRLNGGKEGSAKRRRTEFAYQQH